MRRMGGPLLGALPVMVWLLGAIQGAQAASVTVIPVVPASGDAPALQHLATELALRCPSARHLPFAAVTPLLPHFTRVTAGSAAPELSKLLLPGAGIAAPDSSADLPALKQEFFRSEDWLGLAVRFTRAARDLSADPVALLSAHRADLRESYLFAARALQNAGDTAQARALLLTVATRLSDLPGADAAEWGPNLALLDQQVRSTLPPPGIEVVVEGPAGWAAHVDEQPLGALPRQATRLRAGRHAVVVVGPDGTRVSWQLDLPVAPAAPVHLVADRHMMALCSVAGMTGLCGEPGSEIGTALGRFLDGDLIFIRRQGAQVQGWRQRLGRPALPPVSVAVDGGDHAATLLAHGLCPYEPVPQARKDPRAVGEVHGVQPIRHQKTWPGALLLGVGLFSGLAATPYFIYDGRCIDNDCVRVYDFHLVAPSLIGVGATLAIGGAIWLGLALR